MGQFSSEQLSQAQWNNMLRYLFSIWAKILVPWLYIFPATGSENKTFFASCRRVFRLSQV